MRLWWQPTQERKRRASFLLAKPGVAAAETAPIVAHESSRRLDLDRRERALILGMLSCSPGTGGRRSTQASRSPGKAGHELTVHSPGRARTEDALATKGLGNSRRDRDQPRAQPFGASFPYGTRLVPGGTGRPASQKSGAGSCAPLLLVRPHRAGSASASLGGATDLSPPRKFPRFTCDIHQIAQGPSLTWHQAWWGGCGQWLVAGQERPKLPKFTRGPALTILRVEWESDALD